MVPSGRKRAGKSGKTSMEDQIIRAYDFEKDDKKILSGSEEEVTEGTVCPLLWDSVHVLQFVCFEPATF